MVHNQILEYRWGEEQGFQHCFADGLSGAGYSGIVKMGMKRRGSGREIRLC